MNKKIKLATPNKALVKQSKKSKETTLTKSDLNKLIAIIDAFNTKDKNGTK